MMKRILSAALCAVLMVALLPLAALPARMVATAVYVTVNRTTATVGDTLVWTMNVEPEGGDFQTRIRVHMGATVVYEGTFSTGLIHSYVAEVPGPHYAEAIAYDNADSAELIVNSATTTVERIAAPSITSAVPFSAKAVKLAWTAVPGADGYKLFIATAAAGPYTVVAYPTATTYTKSYLTPGTRYWFKVCAYATVGGVKFESSELSAAKVAVPMGPGLIKTITSPSAGRVILTWDPVLGANGYKVYRATSSGGPYTLVKTTPILSFTDVGLRSRRYYYYKLEPYKRFYTTNYYGPISPVKYVRTK